MNQVLGTVYIIAAASGSGKTSLAKALADSMPQMKISVSHTTRSIRNGEKNGESYFFVAISEFESMIKKNEFLEYAKVFGEYYGTSRSWVVAQLQAGFDVILDIDWQGAAQIRSQFPCCQTVFILPPSRVELRNRLEKRKREETSIIEHRLTVAGSEILHYNEFDYIVINDKFAEALADLQAIVRAERLRLQHQTIRCEKLIAELVGQ